METERIIFILLCNIEIFSLKLSIDMNRLSHGVAPFAETSIDDKEKQKLNEFDVDVDVVSSR